jgi:glycosyltransferase involved in cell wall biosynthesis
MPQVSIGLPVYNGEKYLAETLESLLAQSFTAFEIVITDNASTDGTARICQSYQARDSRIRYFRNPRNIGAAPNFNRAFELSSAPLFQCAADDDLYEPRFLERCVDMLAQDPRLVLCHTRVKVIGDDGEALQFKPDQNRFIDSYGHFVMGPEREDIGGLSEPEIRFREVLWWTTWCFPLFGVMRRAALLKTGLHRHYDGGDKVLLSEMALKGQFYQIRDKLFSKRVHRGCTYYISTREKAEHESGEFREVPPLIMLRDYTKMIWAADLTTKQRLHCLITVLGMTRRPGLWRKLLVPGPDNYLGLSFGAK